MEVPLNVTLYSNLTTEDSVRTNSAMTSQEVDRLLWVYWSPFTFITGMFGNILVIKIFCFSTRKKITTATTSVYFIVMALADACFLLFGILPEWLSACQFVVLQTLHPVMCKLEKFLFYTSGDVAIWIICVNTLDRFIAVCLPFTQQKIRQVAYAKMVAFITLLLATGKNLHVFWTRGLEISKDGHVISKCGRPDEYKYFELYVRPWIAFVLVALVPCLVLTVFNIFIMRFLLRERRRKKVKGRKHHPDFLQTIIMCFSVSAAFVILVTPSLILYIGKPYWSKEGDNYSYKIAKAISNQLSYVNHSINFLLYCITAKKFRDEVFKLIPPLNTLRDFITGKQIFDVENATIVNKGDLLDSPTLKWRSFRFSLKRKSSAKSLNQVILKDSTTKKLVDSHKSPDGQLLRSVEEQIVKHSAVDSNANGLLEKVPQTGIPGQDKVIIDKNGHCNGHVRYEVIEELDEREDWIHPQNGDVRHTEINLDTEGEGILEDQTCGGGDNQTKDNDSLNCENRDVKQASVQPDKIDIFDTQKCISASDQIIDDTTVHCTSDSRQENNELTEC